MGAEPEGTVNFGEVAVAACCAFSFSLLMNEGDFRGYSSFFGDDDSSHTVWSSPRRDDDDAITPADPPLVRGEIGAGAIGTVEDIAVDLFHVGGIFGTSSSCSG